MLRYLTAGESHGPALVGILDGIPAGLSVDVAAIDGQLARRQQGFGRGGRMKIEHDRVRVLAGLRGGVTIGSPIGLLIENLDFANWKDRMDPVAPADPGLAVTVPRPGHADLAGRIKYRHDDLRNAFERASARETAMRVALGTVARIFLETFDIRIGSHVVALGGVESSFSASGLDARALNEAADPSPVRCPDPAASAAMEARIREWAQAGESVGGVFEVVACGVPGGLGSHSQADRRLDGRIAGAMVAIPAMKGVEVGLGFRASALPGSAVHDPIQHGEAGYSRPTNHAGGTEGGVSNGQPIVVRVAMKPLPTLSKPLESVDIRTHEARPAHFERTDKCAVPAASVVGEAVLALVLCEMVLEKTGGDSMAELAPRMAEMRRWEQAC